MNKKKIQKLYIIPLILFILLIIVGLFSAIKIYNLERKLSEIEKSTKKEYDLKKCPFCGGESEIFITENKYGFSGKIVCKKCDVEISYSLLSSPNENDVEKELISKWNSRAE